MKEAIGRDRAAQADEAARKINPPTGLASCQAGGVQRAGIGDLACVDADVAGGWVTQQIAYCAGFNDAGVVDDAMGQRPGRAGRQDHLPARGADRQLVLDEGVQRRAAHCHVEQFVTLDLQRDLVARAECDRAKCCQQHAFIAHFGCEQGDVAACGRSDAALVDNTGALGVAAQNKAVVTTQVILIRQIQRGRSKAARVDLGTGAKQDAIGVDQEHLAIG